MKIGFIGLGNMGAPMAKNLAAAGHEVVGFDTAAVAVEELEGIAQLLLGRRGRLGLRHPVSARHEPSTRAVEARAAPLPISPCQAGATRSVAGRERRAPG